MAKSPTTTPTPQSEKSLQKWAILSVTTLSTFIIALDANIVTLALPRISEDFSSGVSLLGWVITAYLLATVILLLQMGKIGDRYGKKRIYLTGFTIFGIASALCGLSQSILQLISFRLLQGGGAAMLSAASTPLIFESFPQHQRGSAVGTNSIAWAVGAVIGPVVGGIIVSFDWRLIFFINVPITAAAVLIGIKVIPARGKPLADNHQIDQSQQQQLKVHNNNSGSTNNSKVTINVVSSVLLALTVTMMLLWLTFLDSRFALVSVIGLGALVLSEANSRSPLLNQELRKNKAFVFSIASISILQVAYLGIPFTMSFYFQSILNYSPIAAGLWIAPLSLVLVIVNPLAGRLFDKLRASAVIPILGTIVEAIATIILSYAINVEASPIYLVLFLALTGVGGGLVWAPLISSVLKFTTPELRGLANGTCFMLVNIGFAASIAIAIAASATFLPSSVVSRVFFGNLTNLTPSEAILFREGMAEGLLILGLVNFIALPVLYLLLREQKKLH